MGEWKRVFLNPGRLSILLLLVLLCTGLFLLGLMDRVGPQEVRRVRETGKYVSSLTEKWSQEDIEDLPMRAQNELDRLSLYTMYYSDWPYEDLPYTTDEEADESIKDLPYLLEAKEMGEELFLRQNAFYNAVTKKQEEIKYIRTYQEYLEKIQKQAKQQSKTSVFGKEKSFSKRNLKKTAKEFEPLLGTEVSFGNNTGIEKWLDFKLGDYFHLLSIIIIVMAFLEERKKGLWSIVRSLQGGRVKLGLSRVLILTAASFLFTLLFNFLNLFLSIRVYGGNVILSRTIQSVESFRTCTLQTSIGGWLFRYFIVKSVSGVLVGLLIWYLMGSVSNVQLSLSVLIICLAAEYSLFTFLPVQSIFNLFKYLNVFSYVHTTDLYTNYLNINIFGFPVNNRSMMIALLPVLICAFAFLTVRMQAKRYPEGNRDLLSKAALKINTFLDRFRSRLSAFGWEAYKALIFEYGILVIVLMILAGRSLSYRVYLPMDESERWYQMFVKDAEGEITEETDKYIEKARLNAETSQEAGNLLPAIERLEQSVNDIRTRAEERGYTPYLLDSEIIKEYYGDTAKNRQRLNVTVAILFVIFLTGGMMSYEKQSGVVPLLRSLKQGRRGMLMRKLILTAILTLFAFGAVYVREIMEVIENCNRSVLKAPVQNIEELKDFPVVISVRGYMILLYVMRYLMLYVSSLVVLLISEKTPNPRVSYLTAAGILCFPALLIILGADVFRWISPAVPVAQAELLWGLGSGKWAYVIPGIVWLIIGVGAGITVIHNEK